MNQVTEYALWSNFKYICSEGLALKLSCLNQKFMLQDNA